LRLLQLLLLNRGIMMIWTTTLRKSINLIRRGALVVPHVYTLAFPLAKAARRNVHLDKPPQNALMMKLVAARHDSGSPRRVR
jgi:hypothetical protein